MSEYPEEILPQIHFSPTVDLEKVISMTDEFVVCRTIGVPLENAISEDEDGSEILDIDVLGDSIVGMSVNLMGGHFKEWHLKYHTPHKYPSGRYWDGKSEIRLNDFEGQHEIKNDVYPLYYSSNAVHRQKVPFALKNRSKDQLKRISQVFKNAQYIFKNDANVDCEIFVSHKPNNLNYWHSQIELKPYGADDAECFKNSNSFRHEIYIQLLTDVLSRKFLKTLPAGISIPTCTYCRLSRRCRF